MRTHCVLQMGLHLKLQFCLANTKQRYSVRSIFQRHSVGDVSFSAAAAEYTHQSCCWALHFRSRDVQFGIWLIVEDYDRSTSARCHMCERSTFLPIFLLSVSLHFGATHRDTCGFLFCNPEHRQLEDNLKLGTTNSPNECEKPMQKSRTFYINQFWT